MITDKIFERSDLIFRYKVYISGNIINLDTGSELHPSVDPRRPKQPPLVYFPIKEELVKKSKKKRITMYLDDFMAMIFLKDYKHGCTVHHLDGNPLNCELDNLVIACGIKTLKDVYHEEKEWKKVDIGQLLYYDYFICEDGRLYNGTTDKFIIPFEDRRKKNLGYLRYNLYKGPKVSEIIHISAARLVAYHFIPLVEGKDIVLYRDGNPKNISKENLYFGDNWDAMTKNLELESKNRVFQSFYSSSLGEEKWKELDDIIEKFDFNFKPRDSYLISNFGRVYNKSSKFYCTQTNSYPNHLGLSYKRIGIHIIDDHGKYIRAKTLSVHRLVAFAFVKNDDWKTKIDVNHINGNPECNIWTNLEWVSPYENMHHAIRTNLFHTNEFASKDNYCKWRTNVIIAMIFGMYTKDLSTGYKIYLEYEKKYNDDIMELTYDEFVFMFEYGKESDDDFKNLYNFYQGYK